MVAMRSLLIAALLCALSLSLSGCKEPDTDQTRTSSERRSPARENPASSVNEDSKGASGATPEKANVGRDSR